MAISIKIDGIKSHELAALVTFIQSIATDQGEDVIDPITPAPKPFPFYPKPETVNETPVATDKTGIPWDGRIHASSKAINADGTWKSRRNIDVAERNRVEGELRATMAAPITPTSAPQQPNPFMTQGETNPFLKQSVSYERVMEILGDKIGVGELTEDDVYRAVGAVNLPSFTALSNRPDLIPAFMKELGI